MSENRNFKIFIGVISSLVAVLIIILLLVYIVGINSTTFKPITEAEKVEETTAADEKEEETTAETLKIEETTQETLKIEETTQETLKDKTVIPDTSSDRYLIAFVSDRDGDPEIYVMDPDGSNLVQLTDNDSDDI